MKFSFLSWNVEKFRGAGQRLKQVARHIKKQDPDIFGLLEVEGADVPSLIQTHFPDYDFSITDGPQAKEILVGWRRGKFAQATFTQKREFKVYNPSLRPGALLSVTLDATNYHLLYLHTDSGTEGRDFGNRYEMFEHVWKLKKALDRLAGGAGKGNLIVMGDLNTMGLLYPSRRKAHERVSEQEEINALEMFARRWEIQPLVKEYEKTFNNLKLTSDLDHVLASRHLKFTTLGTRPDGRSFNVRVRGWNQLSGNRRRRFIEGISDHSSVYGEVA